MRYRLSSLLSISRQIPLMLFVAAALSACGGGGASDTTQSLSFDGSTQAAAITINNAAKIFKDIYGLSSFSGTGNRSAEPPARNKGIVRLVQTIRDQTYAANSSDDQLKNRGAARSINDTSSCINGGSAQISGELNDNGTGLVTIDFNSCTEDGDTLDGSVSLRILAYDTLYSVETDSIMSFTRLDLRGAGFDYTASGSMHIENTIPTNIERMTINIVARDNLAGIMQKTEDLILDTTYDNIFSPASYTLSQNGRVYDSDLGYVDITTVVPLFYPDMATLYPDRGGELVITGAANSKIHVIAASASKVRLEVDPEGDDIYAEHFVYYWSDLGGATSPNEPLVFTSVTILPANPSTTDELTIDLQDAWDPDADPLEYAYVWSRNGTPIAGQTSNSLPADHHSKGDVISAEVTASDGFSTATQSSSVTILNTLPVIDAGPSGTHTIGTEITLNGTATDADNDPLTYSWSLLTQPYDGIASFSDAQLPHPVLNYSAQGDYLIELSVSDGEITVSDTIELSIEPMPLFAPYFDIYLPSMSESAAIGDVNGDGLNDVVVSTSSYFDADNDSHIFVLLQKADGTLDLPVKYDAGLSPTQYQITSIAIADMNNDGWNDVIVSHENAIGILLQESDGTLSPVTLYTTNHSSYSNTSKLVAADFNGDNLTDVASIDWGTQSDDVNVFLQNSSNTLDPPVTYQAPHGGRDDLAFGDINGDGLNDILVMSGVSYPTNTLSILLQQSDHTFASAVSYDLGVNQDANAVGVGDVNGDGRDDVVLAYGGNRPTSKIAIFYQNSGGTLDAPIHLPAYDIPGAAQIADINNDGLQDIVIGHDGWHALTVYLQKPDGSLLPHQRYPFSSSSSNPHGMAVGDINADGNLDVVQTNSTSGISVIYHQ